MSFFPFNSSGVQQYVYYFPINYASANVEFHCDDDVNSHNKSYPIENISEFNLPVGEKIVSGSFYAHQNGTVIADESGQLVCRYANGVTDIVGTIDYFNKRLTWHKSAPFNFTNPSGLFTQIGDKGINTCSFVIPSMPIIPESFSVTAQTLDGEKLSASADSSGNISGSGITGKIEYANGWVTLNFGTKSETFDIYKENGEKETQTQETPILVAGETITYNAVSYLTLPLNSEGLGIDPARLPSDGRVPIFRRGDMIVISNKQKETLGSAFTAGQTIKLSRNDLDGLCLFDSADKKVESKWYEKDLENGTITFARPLDLSAYQLPLIAHTSWEEENRILNLDLDGTLTLQFPLSRDYPIENTYVSSALIAGDLQVRHSAPFTQRSFDNVWSDEIRGEVSRNRLNLTNYPMVLSDDGAITDRWAIVFVDSTRFDLLSEALGVIGRFDLISDLAPINPATNKPYFTIPKQAFGTSSNSSWASGETIRFDTFGTHFGFWAIRAVQPSANKIKGKDGFTLCLRGNTVDEE